MLMEKERALVVEYGKKLSTSGLCPGTSGNVSIYDPETGYMCISPSGMDYFETEPEDIVVTDLDAHIIESSRKPSSEWALHTQFYKNKPHARAVIHTHSLYCTTYAVLGRPIEAVHYVIGDCGAKMIPCAPYQTFGTVELADAAMEVIGDSNCVLLGNHGIVCCGNNISNAFSAARNAEYCAQLQFQAECIGKPNVLTGADIDEVLIKFQSYGQTSGTKTGY